YSNHAQLPHLSDRDEEIWLPLYAVASILFPERMDDLVRASVDLSMEKTAPIRKHTDLRMSDTDAERAAMESEYAERLVLDMLTVMGTQASEQTSVLLERLLALPSGPWRRIGGEQLEPRRLAALLDIHNVKPKDIRVKGTKNTVRKGYTRDS